MKNVAFVFCFLFSVLTHAINTVPNNVKEWNSEYHFIENKGQIVNQSGMIDKNVAFYLERENTSIYLLKNGIAWQFNQVKFPVGYKTLMNKINRTKAEEQLLEKMKSEVVVEKYRMDMELLDASLPVIKTEEKSTDYIHFVSRQIVAHHYKKVVYENVYPGIDWVIYTTEEGMKYDFIVHPGADPSMIKMKFNHHSVLKIDQQGQLIHANRLGQFTEKKPVSFQGDKAIETSFHLDGNILGFDVDNYNKNEELVIDPARIWGTYYGGSLDDYGYSCNTDATGNVYLAGYTLSTSAIASGGYQNTLGGNYDAMLVKFNSSGVRQWATYFGGTNADFCYASTVDASGNIFITGSTISTSAIALGGHQNTYGGGTDAYLAKFNPSGSLLWSTYYGGTTSDKGFGCAADASGNIYLSGETNSTASISTAGSHQSTKGTNFDGFLVKFNSSGTRQWATYYGGNGDDIARACFVDGNSNVYIAGEALSTNAIASGGHQNSIAGGYDAYLAKFNSSGVRQWATYYGGSSQEGGISCVTDASNNVYLAGNSNSSSGISSGGHQNTLGGGNDGFLVKFNASGTRQWATYYGGSGEDFGRSCRVDGSGNVFMCGYTTSTSAIASLGHQNTYGGGFNDAFVVKFNTSGTRQWASYYGGTAIDESYTCAIDPTGNVYITGYTQSATGIGSGGHQNTFGGSRDGFLVKFLGTAPTITTGSITGTSFCAGEAVVVPFTVSDNFLTGNIFTAQLSDATGSFTTPVNIGTLNSPTSGSINATIPSNTPSGTGYRIRVTGSVPVSIGSSNGSNLSIFANNTGTAVITECDSYTWINGTTYTSNNNSATYTLTNINGCDSVVTLNLTILTSVRDTQVVNACNSYTWLDGTTYTSSTNTPVFTVSGAHINNCDSIYYLHLTIIPVDVTVSENVGTITAGNATADAYQWIDCDSNTPMAGDTNQTFTPIANGSYAVQITSGSCIVTSECITIDNVGLENQENSMIQMYPNPTQGAFTIQLNEEASLRITDATGRVVLKTILSNTINYFNLVNESRGVYFIYIETEKNQITKKLILID
jgi:hypothetical protein